MSAESTVHGADIPSPKWWVRFRNVPLVILTVLSVAAAIVGWTAQSRLDAANNAIAAVPTQAPTLDAVGEVCRPAVELPSSSPWTEDPAGSEALWQEHQAELAGPVVEGIDGWVTFNDQIETNFSQAVGRRLLSASELKSWTEYFSSIDTALKEQGIELSIQITPTSTSVYPETLPAWVQELRGPTALDQLLLAGDELPIVDFRADLREAAADDAVYTPVNTHWTDWGGYIAWQTYAACHDALYPENSAIAVPEVSGVEEVGIFNEYAPYGIADAEPQWNAPVFSDALVDVAVTDNQGVTKTVTGESTVELGMLPASTATDGSVSDQTALIMRDSMGSALSPYWAQQYAQTWQIQHRYDDWSNPPNYAALVAQYQPDVVIIQLAERHLVNAPAVTSGF